MDASIDRILPADFRRFERSEVESSLPARLDRIVAKYPAQVAIEDGDVEVTYAELDRESNRVAHRLLEELGGDPEPIALLYEQGASFHKAQFGVLKSGKFYACLDPELRAEKRFGLLADLGARAILCSAKMEPVARESSQGFPGMRVINIEEASLSSAVTRPDVEVGPDHRACVIYTSGSTGPPVGVATSHRSMLHFTMNQTNSMHIRVGDRCSQVCPLSSAAMGGETFAALLNGATLLPIHVKTRGPRHLARWLREHRVTVFVAVPTLFRLVAANIDHNGQFPDMRLVRLSGDRILKKDFDLFQRHFSDRCLLRASLGAAEAQLYSHFYLHRSSSLDREVVPAGYALEDMTVLVVDDDLNRLKPGEVGEIAVESRYLSIGYWNNDALTAQRFLDSPAQQGAKIYLTRDIGYLQDDGCLIHLGRKDSRVKLYGKMVMLTDLEEALLQLPDIENAVVVPILSEGADTTLVAYFVTRGGASPSHDSMRQHLLSRFPIEVLPKKFVRLDELPTTDRSKIDRRQLMYGGRVAVSAQTSSGTPSVTR
jgi:amino acid adenylation domain-containing protein